MPCVSNDLPILKTSIDFSAKSAFSPSFSRRIADFSAAFSPALIPCRSSIPALLNSRIQSAFWFGDASFPVCFLYASAFNCIYSFISVGVFSFSFAQSRNICVSPSTSPILASATICCCSSFVLVLIISILFSTIF